MIRKVESLLIHIHSKLLKRKNTKSDDEITALFREQDIRHTENLVRTKQIKTVAFFCMSVSMWKYDTIFRALQTLPNYNPLIFVAPRDASWEERKANIRQITNLCINKKYNFVPLKNDFFNIGQSLDEFSIDIAFFTQPYANVICKEYSFEHLTKSLLCYVPYGYYLAHQKFCYASLLNKIAWKNFYPSDCSVEEAKSFGQRTCNILVTGYPGYDMYKESSPLAWKQKGKKNIIWAPHFSVAVDGWMHMSSFMQICDFMLEIAFRYKDVVQFAFKPHPHLYSALCHEWGETRTIEYYHKWAKGCNTMLCTAENYSLFKSSDAMIHDCGSFLMEYLYTQNPCMYLYLNNKNDFNLNEAGQAAMDAHYKAYNIDDIDKFIRMIIKDEEDPKAQNRAWVFEKFIMPQNGRTATENIIAEL